MYKQSIIYIMAVLFLILSILLVNARIVYLNERIRVIEQEQRIEILLDELDYCYGSEIYYYQPQMIRIKPE